MRIRCKYRQQSLNTFETFYLERMRSIIERWSAILLVDLKVFQTVMPQVTQNFYCQLLKDYGTHMRFSPIFEKLEVNSWFSAFNKLVVSSEAHRTAVTTVHLSSISTELGEMSGFLTDRAELFTITSGCSS